MTLKDLVAIVWLVSVPLFLFLILLAIVYSSYRIWVLVKAVLDDIKAWVLAGREHARTAREKTEAFASEAIHIQEQVTHIQEQVEEIKKSINPMMTEIKADMKTMADHVGGQSSHNLPAVDPSVGAPTPPPPPTKIGSLLIITCLALAGAAGTANVMAVLLEADPTPATVDANDPIFDAGDAFAAMKNRDYRQARDLFLRSAGNGMDLELALGRAAECSYYLGELDDTLALCDKLNNSVPNAGRANYLRGMVWLKRGKEQEAVSEFRVAASHGDPVALARLKGRGQDPRSR